LIEAEPFLPHESALPDDVLESMTATGNLDERLNALYAKYIDDGMVR
jgi:hypothetical protein